MIPTKEAMLIGLAALAGFALTMGGWNPILSGDQAGTLVMIGLQSAYLELYRLAAWGAMAAAVVAGFIVLRRRR